MAKAKPRRGFLSEAHWWANELRKEMGLSLSAPICPRRLCTHLEVPVILLSSLPDLPEKHLLLSQQKGCGFSAAACFDGTRAFILLNDATERKRQASDIAHELAHVILRHQPVNPFTNGGIREFSSTDELEAETLGPVLLVSEYAALDAYRMIQRRQYTLTTLSEAWGITEQVISWRMNAVGASRRVKRAA
ncbi:ImmA/IrrE family metallo-endopeptidase [Tabrizicola soli]|uniref:ImmA/IrrE family metallo-endopeptidase n=1 Tax=Tabrizicola soli TaxID=2185115 RepID=A0ABV7E065_9RHOB|nr:ImmA/IrrE family metallo-endopeptidase [Tabrizicola soli]